jgi:uncharacterized protein (DUF305 family)
MRRATPAMMTSVFILAAGAALAGCAGGSGAAPVLVPAATGVEVGFARDMQAHHGQAVEMSLQIAHRTSDPAIRRFADDIATGQQFQIGRMYGWLEVWGIPQTGLSTDWMSGPGHSSAGGMATHAPGAMADMSGMATPEEVAELGRLKGRAADVTFLRLMIAHHEGGVRMAQAALDQTAQPQVVNLARSIVHTQTAEITELRSLLRDRRADS